MLLKPPITEPPQTIDFSILVAKDCSRLVSRILTLLARLVSERTKIFTNPISIYYEINELIVFTSLVACKFH